MPIVLLIARLLLAAVFLVAGCTKLFDRKGSFHALTDFGVPGWLAAPLCILLPLAELTVFAALLPISTAWFGATVAFLLLLVFLLAIGINLARGRTPDCHCFGQLHSAPVGWSTLVRNALLLAVAGLIVWRGRHDPGLSITGWLGNLTTPERVALLGGLVGLVLLTGQGALLLQMLRQQGRLLLRLDALEARFTGGGAAAIASVPAEPTVGLPIGARAPNFSLDGLQRENLTLNALAASGKPLLLLFTNPHCGPCQALMPEISRWQLEHAASLTIALLSEGTVDDNRAKIVGHGLSQVLLQQNREVAEAYQAWGTPAAVLVRPDGSIGSPVAQGADSIRALMARIVGSVPTQLSPSGGSRPRNGQSGNGSNPVPRQPALKLGDSTPHMQFHDLEGLNVSLADLRGRDVLLLFWNPGCGFCQQMLNDLKKWEADPPLGAPKLLVISTGSVEANLAMNLRSPVLLDPSSHAGAAFGAYGTPMAILLDADGRVASQIAVGAQAVLTLAGGKPSIREQAREPSNRLSA